MYRLLIIDDEEDMQHLIGLYIQNGGYETVFASNSESALEQMRRHEIDLVLLDIMMPGKDGFQVCEEICSEYDVPVIFLSAKGEEWDKVKGLKLGADDYIVKPFSPGELLARIEAVLRRWKKSLPVSSELVKKGLLTVDLLSRKVVVNGKTVNLTLKEYELLLLLIQNDQLVFTREQLLDRVWGGEYIGGTRTVDTHIKTLRMKMGKPVDEYIQTVWGVGYRFEVRDT
ncbi:transcriptional regulator [Bacillus coahuilensis m2-6]|uniref:Transcriptional regulator n=1 Tax=Bacillus coahuilensis p1.1.43 TaxID=1150625 RepID=A0A147KAM0_9BACI|nr:response regulator transcription factor [Bacillus coahuilensis]KUP07714.1 transcriptional regulator [Bacillus coahuilensis p1.1.43]KUP09173.1 transcriptional regulator [Bacillus coahuilensis m2-6]